VVKVCGDQKQNLNAAKAANDNTSSVAMGIAA